MKLIEFDNFQIKPADEIFLIRPIRRLFNKDRSVNKEKFWQQLSYLYFMVDPASSYMYIADSQSRAKEIILQEGLPEDFTPSADLKEAMDIYAKHCETTSTLLLKDTRLAIDKLREFLKTVDLNAKDDKGKPIYQINAITSAIKQIPELAKALSEAEKTIQKELLEEGRARGGNDMTLMDNDDIL